MEESNSKFIRKIKQGQKKIKELIKKPLVTFIAGVLGGTAITSAVTLNHSKTNNLNNDDLVLNPISENYQIEESELLQDVDEAYIKGYGKYRVLSDVGINLRSSNEISDDNRVGILNTGDLVTLDECNTSIDCDENVWARLISIDESEADEPDYDGNIYMSLNKGLVEKIDDRIEDLIRYEVTIDNLTVRNSMDTNNKQITLPRGSIVVADKNTFYVDENNKKWANIAYYLEDNDKRFTGYITIDNSYLREFDNEITGEYQSQTLEKDEYKPYEDVEITDDDIKKLANFIDSWENTYIYGYIHGGGAEDYTSKVAEYISEDKSEYYAYFDENWNYGFGVMTYYVPYSSYNNLELFEKYGIDIRNNDIDDPLEIIRSVPRDVCDKVHYDFIKDKIAYVKAELERQDIYFSKEEILATTAVIYQYAPSVADNIIEAVKDVRINGGHVYDLKNNFVSDGGKYIFQETPGSTIVYNGEYLTRGDAYWSLFYNSEYIMGSGDIEMVKVDEPVSRFDEIEENEESIKPLTFSLDEIKNSLRNRLLENSRDEI